MVWLEQDLTFSIVIKYCFFLSLCPLVCYISSSSYLCLGQLVYSIFNCLCRFRVCIIISSSYIDLWRKSHWTLPSRRVVFLLLCSPKTVSSCIRLHSLFLCNYLYFCYFFLERTVSLCIALL